MPNQFTLKQDAKGYAGALLLGITLIVLAAAAAYAVDKIRGK